MSKYESKIFIENRNRVKDEAISLYKTHYSLKKVGELLGIHSKTVARILKENGVEYKGRGEASQLVRENPFDNKSVEDKSYWIGFIAGDGYISREKNLIHITSIDYELITHFKNFIGDGVQEANKLLESGMVYTACFSHKGAKEYLVKRGVTTKKSLTLKFNVKLNWNIVRGLFDADGSFSQHRLKITTGSPYVTQQLVDFFKENDIETTVQPKGGKSNCVDVYILGGKDTIRIVYRHFYSSNPSYFLTRKKEQIRRYIE